MRNVIGLLCIVLFISSCIKEEIPVSSPTPGNVQMEQVGMENDYKYQIYFNLKQGENVGQNFKSEWDLGFECDVEGWHIILNSAKLMKIAKTNTSDFASILDTNGNYNWKYDGVTGHLDSTAVGDWEDHKQIYIIDRGYDEKSRHQGFYKILFNSWNENSYDISFCELNELASVEKSIDKNESINFTSFTFDNGGEVLFLEPNKNNWDLLFTQYTEKLWDSEKYVPYLVTGVQINRFMTFATLEEDRAFDDIVLEDMPSYYLEDRIDQPGYGWKIFNFEEEVYTVFSEKIYIIQTNEGVYYKLRFTDFYSDEGEKGYPTFEYQKL